MDLNKINTTALAFLGDAVYEVYVREHLLDLGLQAPDKLHRAAVRYVHAPAQEAAIKTLFNELIESERALVKRARNKRSASRPKNCTPITYKWATSFEALIGYLYLEGRTERMEEIIAESIDIIESTF
ncbi:MAG: ribonuclease III domain-containing protein [Anaerovoracaceae bacterium]|nr:ribonuclease III domain-containing protein [Anaerovoracaceae bacterium]